MMLDAEKHAALLANAKEALAEAQRAYADAQRQMVALNAKGVEIEKQILGLQGEVRALEALSDGGQ